MTLNGVMAIIFALLQRIRQLKKGIGPYTEIICQ